MQPVIWVYLQIVNSCCIYVRKETRVIQWKLLMFLGLTFWIFAPLSVTQPLIIVFTWQQRGKRGVGSCFAARRKKRQLGGFFSSASISSLLLRQRTASFSVCYETWSDLVEAVLRFQTTSKCLQDRESTSGTSPQTPGRGMSKNSSR